MGVLERSKIRSDQLWRGFGYTVGLFAVAMTMAFSASAADTAPVLASTDLRQLSIEDLSNIEVSSVSKSVEPLSDAPAAIYVISHDDIIRSGATSIPEMLRLAPNLQVARRLTLIVTRLQRADSTRRSPISQTSSWC